MKRLKTFLTTNVLFVFLFTTCFSGIEPLYASTRSNIASYFPGQPATVPFIRSLKNESIRSSLSIFVENSSVADIHEILKKKGGLDLRDQKELNLIAIHKERGLLLKKWNKLSQALENPLYNETVLLEFQEELIQQYHILLQEFLMPPSFIRIQNHLTIKYPGHSKGTLSQDQKFQKAFDEIRRLKVRFPYQDKNERTRFVDLSNALGYGFLGLDLNLETKVKDTDQLQLNFYPWESKLYTVPNTGALIWYFLKQAEEKKIPETTEELFRLFFKLTLPGHHLDSILQNLQRRMMMLLNSPDEFQEVRENIARIVKNIEMQYQKKNKEENKLYGFLSLQKNTEFKYQIGELSIHLQPDIKNPFDVLINVHHERTVNIQDLITETQYLIKQGYLRAAKKKMKILVASSQEKWYQTGILAHSLMIDDLLDRKSDSFPLDNKAIEGEKVIVEYLENMRQYFQNEEKIVTIQEKINFANLPNAIQKHAENIKTALKRHNQMLILLKDLNTYLDKERTLSPPAETRLTQYLSGRFKDTPLPSAAEKKRGEFIEVQVEDFEHEELKNIRNQLKKDISDYAKYPKEFIGTKRERFSEYYTKAIAEQIRDKMTDIQQRMKLKRLTHLEDRFPYILVIIDDLLEIYLRPEVLVKIKDHGESFLLFREYIVSIRQQLTYLLASTKNASEIIQSIKKDVKRARDIIKNYHKNYLVIEVNEKTFHFFVSKDKKIEQILNDKFILTSQQIEKMELRRKKRGGTNYLRFDRNKSLPYGDTIRLGLNHNQELIKDVILRKNKKEMLGTINNLKGKVFELFLFEALSLKKKYKLIDRFSYQQRFIDLPITGYITPDFVVEEKRAVDKKNLVLIDAKWSSDKASIIRTLEGFHRLREIHFQNNSQYHSVRFQIVTIFPLDIKTKSELTAKYPDTLFISFEDLLTDIDDVILLGMGIDGADTIIEQDLEDRVLDFAFLGTIRDELNEALLYVESSENDMERNLDLLSHLSLVLKDQVKEEDSDEIHVESDQLSDWIDSGFLLDRRFRGKIEWANDIYQYYLKEDDPRKLKQLIALLDYLIKSKNSGLFQDWLKSPDYFDYHLRTYLSFIYDQVDSKKDGLASEDKEELNTLYLTIQSQIKNLYRNIRGDIWTQMINSRPMKFDPKKYKKQPTFYQEVLQYLADDFQNTRVGEYIEKIKVNKDKNYQILFLFLMIQALIDINDLAVKTDLITSQYESIQAYQHILDLLLSKYTINYHEFKERDNDLLELMEFLKETFPNLADSSPEVLVAKVQNLLRTGLDNKDKIHHFLYEKKAYYPAISIRHVPENYFVAYDDLIENKLMTIEQFHESKGIQLPDLMSWLKGESLIFETVQLAVVQSDNYYLPSSQKELNDSILSAIEEQGDEIYFVITDKLYLDLLSKDQIRAQDLFRKLFYLSFEFYHSEQEITPTYEYLISKERKIDDFLIELGITAKKKNFVVAKELTDREYLEEQYKKYKEDYRKNDHFFKLKTMGVLKFVHYIWLKDGIRERPDPEVILSFLKDHAGEFNINEVSIYQLEGLFHYFKKYFIHEIDFSHDRYLLLMRSRLNKWNIPFKEEEEIKRYFLRRGATDPVMIRNINFDNNPVILEEHFKEQYKPYLNIPYDFMTEAEKEEFKKYAADNVQEGLILSDEDVKEHIEKLGNKMSIVIQRSLFSNDTMVKSTLSNSGKNKVEHSKILLRALLFMPNIQFNTNVPSNVRKNILKKAGNGYWGYELLTKDKLYINSDISKKEVQDRIDEHRAKRTFYMKYYNRVRKEYEIEQIKNDLLRYLGMSISYVMTDINVLNSYIEQKIQMSSPQHISSILLRIQKDMSEGRINALFVNEYGKEFSLYQIMAMLNREMALQGIYESKKEWQFSLTAPQDKKEIKLSFLPRSDKGKTYNNYEIESLFVYEKEAGMKDSESINYIIQTQELGHNTITLTAA